MILAAAIKFHIKATGKDVVLCGARHGDVFNQLAPLGLSINDGVEEVEQGFIDHQNNFLTRIEAFAHAKQCGQISSRIVFDREHGKAPGGCKLISEDLY